MFSPVYMRSMFQRIHFVPALGFVGLMRKCLVFVFLCLGFGVASLIHAAGEAQSSSFSPDTKTIVVLGDSLSAAHNMAEADGWVSILSERLKTYVDTKSSFFSKDRDVTGYYQVVNGSVSGATTAAGLQMLPRLLERHRPAIVILELGANDGLQGKPIRYISKNLAALLSKIESGGAKTLLVGIKLPPNYGKAYTEPFFKQYEALSKQFNTRYLPFLLEGVAGDPSLMMRDGLHPKAEAQMRILDNVWSELLPLL